MSGGRTLRRTMMDRGQTVATDNSLEAERILNALLGRIADQETLLIITALAVRTMRLSDLQATQEAIAPRQLVDTLRRMERDGLVARRLHRLVPPRVDYQLTPLGASLAEAVHRIWNWAERHGADPARALRSDEGPLRRIG